MLDYLAIPCLLTDESLSIISVNNKAVEVFGRSLEPDAFHHTPRLITRLITSDLAAFFRWVELDNEQKSSMILEIKELNTTQKYLVNHSRHYVDEKITFFFTFSPVSQKADSNSKAELYQQAFEYSNQSIYLTDENNTILFVNPSFTHFFGLSHAQAKGKKDHFLYHNEGQEIHRNAIETLLNEVDQIEKRMPCVTSFNADLPIMCNVNIAMIHDDEGDKFLHFVEDITKQVNSEKIMQNAAFKDPLTGIDNRLSFNHKFNDLFIEAQRQGEQLSVFFIDLDKFKFVNDQYGHEYGDALLIQVAKTLKTNNSANHFVARLGGDEFVILIQNNNPRFHLESIAKQILAAFSRPFLLKDLQYKCSCSIGIAQYPDDAMTQTELLNAADNAMYMAKKSGRNDFSFYNDEEQKIINLNDSQFNKIEKTIEDNKMHLHFQPIHNMVTGEVLSFEALARYKDQDGVLHHAEEFIHIIENDPVMHKLGVDQIKEIRRHLKVLKYHGVQLPISINLSSYQIKSSNIIEQLELIAQKSPDLIRLLKIEVTETVLFENDMIAVKNLNYISKLGFSLILDDFGKGHSSIYSLKEINFETIKINSNFVEEINTTLNDEKKFLSAIIGMIKNLNINIICEGVENKQQIDYLLKRGCTSGQGFYYSKAMPRNDILTYLSL